MRDKKGNPYLRLSDAKAGMTIWLDGDFTCASSGPKILKTNKNGELSFECDEGDHLIDGQADDGEYCIGVYPKAPA